MASSNANAIPHDQDKSFNPTFLGYLILCTALSIFFLLYFNRLFAWLVAHAIRTWTWRRYRVFIDFQALQFSLLGGRVFFTGLRYHGPNETFHIQNGHVTWSYWLRRVRDVEVGAKKPNLDRLNEKQAPPGTTNSPDLPCRINVTLNGLEWFVYNRTPVYDSLLRGLTDDVAPVDSAASAESLSQNDGPGEALNLNKANIHQGERAPDLNEYKASASSSNELLNQGASEEAESSFLLSLFPIHMECRTAALVMGNENTKAVLVVKADDVFGDVDAIETSTPDPYRQLFKFNYRHPVVEMRPNEDYKEDQESRAVKRHEPVEEAPPTKRLPFFSRHRRAITRRMRNLVPIWRKSVESFSPSGAEGQAQPVPPGFNHWQGLSRYLHDDMEDNSRWASVEYAANPSIIDSPFATMTMYWDVPARVSQVAAAQQPGERRESRGINGETPPAWGINLSIQGGTVSYGPWADRQRAELQRFFFPSLCKDASPAEPLKAGDYRVPTKFSLYVELDEGVTIRIPTREPSKNWKFRGKEPHAEANAPQQKRKQRSRSKKPNASDATRIRPAGWLDLKVDANATVSYSMDMVAGPSGYATTLDVDLPGTEVSSSVNHELLWRSGPLQVACDLSSPLKWNALRTWKFDVSSRDLELFLLREHVFLLIDLVDDWTTGPPPDYLVFTPFKYGMNLDLANVKVLCNVNDANIINSPTSLDDNAYVVFSSPLVQSAITIPTDTFRPTKNYIPFDIRADSLAVSLHLPPYNTQATFLRSKSVGQAENVEINGQYHYNATTSTANTDTLVLNVSGQSPTATLHGFIVRYFLCLKDNYFGDYVHFRTLEEYQRSLRQEGSSVEAQARQAPRSISNDLDVVLNLRIDDVRVLLPANLYDSSRNIQIETASLGVDLRFTNYYMDVDLVISPLSLSLGVNDHSADTPTPLAAPTQLFLDGVRVYGHRLFGLPPTEPTYLCNWDLSLGNITGECTAEFLTTLARAGKAFIFGFADEENALISLSAITLYDVTFLRVAVQSVRLWLHVDDAAFLLSTEAINVNFNDWARTHYSQRANITIPGLQLSCLDADTAARQKSRPNRDIKAEGMLRTSLNIAIIGRKFKFSEERKLQQELVRREDQRTHRTQFLLFPELMGEFTPDVTDDPAQCVPPVPGPTAETDSMDGSSFTTGTPSMSIPSLRRQSSFLSLSSTSQSSVIRTNASRSRSRGKAVVPALGPHRSAAHLREFSTSSERHSAFYTVPGDNTQVEAARPSTVTFSSQYFAPHFPLENVNPDASDAILPSVEADDTDDADSVRTLGFDLEDIDPEILSDDHTYTSVIVESPSGISAFLSPASVRYITSLLSAVQPGTPEDALDALQVGCMTDIIDLKKLVGVRGEVLDLMVRIPSATLRFLNSPILEYQEVTDQPQDQYDAVFNKVAFVTRETTRWQDPFETDTKECRRSFHLRVGSIGLTASERFPDVNKTQAAVMAHVDHAVVSMGSRDVTYIDAEVRAVRGSTASGKIDYLAGLIHRTNIMASELTDMLSAVISTQEDRIKLLTHTLAALGRHAGDAAFFTRPSAVLRSAENHVRTFDSWKLMMRLRHIWNNLNLEEKEELYLACWGSRPSPSPKAAEDVREAFQRWRSWDLGDLSKSVLLRSIFALSNGKQSTPKNIPLLAACEISEVEFVLDPGPKENKTSIIDLSARLEQRDSRPDAPEGSNDVEGPLAVLNIQCDEAAMNLNWELCELASNVLRVYSESSGPERPVSPRPPKEPEPAAPPKPAHALHVVFSLSRGSVAVDTVNLSANTLVNGLTASFLAQGLGSESPTSNFLLNCEGITSRLHSHSQLVGMFQLGQPSIFAFHEVQEADGTSYHTVKATSSSKNLTLIVKQDPTALLEIADLLVRDEASQLYSLKDQLALSAPKPKKENTKIAERLCSYKLDLSLFLGDYNMNVPLLQSLTYNISGVGSRASMAANFGKEMVFDFDIGENSHEIRVQVGKQPKTISLLRIPPTNGRITSRIGDAEHALALFASIELIQLDASAVYSLLRAINRPEISNAIQDVQEQLGVIRGHVNEVFGSDQVERKDPVSQTASRIAYTLHLTLTGLEIFGTTRLEVEGRPIAHLLACFDKMHFEMSNQLESGGPILNHPELHVHLGQILFDIQKGHEDCMESCGSIAFSALISATTRTRPDGDEERAFSFRSDGFEVILSPDTVSTVVDVLGYLGDKIKDLDTSRELEYIRKLRQSKPKIAINDEQETDEPDIIDSFLSSFVYQFEVHNTRLSWLVPDTLDASNATKEDLVLSLQLFEFGTRKTKSARLTIQNFQLQMVPPGLEEGLRSHHSALLPEVVFNVAYFSTADARRLAFQAVGKSLDLRLTSGFIGPAFRLKDSINLSMQNVQQASRNWNTGISATKPDEPTSGRSILGTKRLESLLVDADFAGAVVHMSAKKPNEPLRGQYRAARSAPGGKYGQFTDDAGASVSLRSPGLAWKLEYRDDGKGIPSLCGEVKIEASSNILHPSVVPLAMDIMSGIKEVVSNDSGSPTAITSPDSPLTPPSEEDKTLTADAAAVLGRLNLNLGLRICKQEFTLSCQPIARVAATTFFENIYVTVNTVRSGEAGNFLAVSAAINNLQASVQHVYSRESTGSFEIESIVLSLMNSKHFSGRSGLSAILKFSPMKIAVNAKQLQDFLLFREIWYPAEVRQASVAPVAKLQAETSQGHLVQRYQQVAATAAFPWTATVSISSLEISVDLGQAIGKSVFAINDFWVSSKKTSDWEQNLCLGFGRIGADCVGRLSGYVALQDFRLRSSIQWPEREQALNETPMIQASIGFSQFRLKAAFDYQAFLVADITSLQFLMYNVRRSMDGSGDRLVAIFDGEAIQVFGTTTSAALGVALYQAMQKLIHERKANFETSLKEIERFMRRRSSSITPATSQERTPRPKLPEDDTLAKSPISLDTDVVVTLKALNLGVFPSTFSDHQVFKMEATDAQARFAANVVQRRVHSILDLTLGQLRIGLAAVRDVEAPRTLTEISVEDVVERATGSRGGTILKVPRVHAAMETWQSPKEKRIEYVFKSAFEGKVEVGWNYSRISYIRGMWANHAKTLAQTWGKELAVTAIKVTGVLGDEGGGGEGGKGGQGKKGSDGGEGSGSEESTSQRGQQQNKITAEVNVPQSKYDYVALEEPVIETPRLREMGEATPPLEWIGLHRDRLPNLTHQIVIVSLLELAGEVEDAYARILGSS